MVTLASSSEDSNINDVLELLKQLYRISFADDDPIGVCGKLLMMSCCLCCVVLYVEKLKKWKDGCDDEKHIRLIISFVNLYIISTLSLMSVFLFKL